MPARLVTVKDHRVKSRGAEGSESRCPRVEQCLADAPAPYGRMDRQPVQVRAPSVPARNERTDDAVPLPRDEACSGVALEQCEYRLGRMPGRLSFSAATAHSASSSGTSSGVAIPRPTSPGSDGGPLIPPSLAITSPPWESGGTGGCLPAAEGAAGGHLDQSASVARQSILQHGDPARPHVQRVKNADHGARRHRGRLARSPSRPARRRQAKAAVAVPQSHHHAYGAGRVNRRPRAHGLAGNTTCHFS
jgi:hypothetical protein